MGGKQNGILEEWLRNMVALIFLQTFHAIFLTFIMEIISAVSAWEPGAGSAGSTSGATQLVQAFGSEDVKLSLIVIVAMFALLKMEKMVKNIFGIKDSKYAKGLQESFSGGVAKVASAVDMAKRTAQAQKDKKEKARNLKIAKKETADANDKRMKKEAKHRALQNVNTNNMTIEEKAEHQKKLDKARTEAEEAKKDYDKKKSAQIKAEADYKNSKRYARTALATDIASMTFALGDPTLANLVDRGLDSVATRFNKNAVYGSSAKNIEKKIQQKMREEAENRVIARGKSRDDADFQEEVTKVMNSESFKSDMHEKLKAEIDAKFQLELEIPETSLGNIGQQFKDTFKNMSKYKDDVRGMFRDIADSEEIGGTAYSRKVRKSGIRYKGTSLDDVSDI